MSHLPASLRVFAITTLCFLVMLVPVYAQGALTGSVRDELGGAIAGAAVTVRTATGSLVAAGVTDAAGAFSLPALTPGRYEVEAAMPLFASVRLLLDVPQGRDAPPVRLVMAVAGLVESMVVTGRRTEARLSETPQKIEVVDAKDIEPVK